MRLKTRFKISHYISVLKRQPVHIQHIFAVLFSGAVTLLLSISILYFDYGFWREDYSKKENSKDEIIITKDDVPSPVDTFSTFFQEAENKIKNMKEGDIDFFNGKQSYSKREEFLRGEVGSSTVENP